VARARAGFVSEVRNSGKAALFIDLCNATCFPHIFAFVCAQFARRYRLLFHGYRTRISVFLSLTRVFEGLG